MTKERKNKIDYKQLEGYYPIPNIEGYYIDDKLNIINVNFGYIRNLLFSGYSFFNYKNKEYSRKKALELAKHYNDIYNKIFNEDGSLTEDYRYISISDKYIISKDGNIYSTIGIFKEIKKNYKGNRLVFTFNGKKYYVHHLVLESFGFPRPSNKHIVRHLNDIPDDNRLENLEWDYQIVNMKDKKINNNKRYKAIKELYKKGISKEIISIACKLSLSDLDNIIV
jgi:hypothetical protein